MTNREIKVSIICTTYNHERFVAQALDGFVNQKTSFNFEVIVHDDASMDDTPDIILAYEKRYPGLIAPILQSENLYSRGLSPAAYTYPKARGEYIALCEGDDWWIDPLKLEKQIGYMESNPGCTFCFSNARLYDEGAGRFASDMLPGTEQDQRVLESGDYLDVSDMIKMSFIPTATFVFRKADYLRLPAFPQEAFRGDRFLQLVLTSFGYAHYLDEVVSVYRVNNPKSMMSVWAKDPEAGLKAAKGYVRLYEEFDSYTNGRYHDAIAEQLVERRYIVFAKENDYRSLRKREYLNYARAQGPFILCKHVFRVVFPRLFLLAKGLLK